MGVIDEILNPSGGKMTGVPEEETQSPTQEPNDGSKMNGVPEEVIQQQTTQSPQSITTLTPASKKDTPAKPLTYVEMLEKTNTYKEPTPEELEKEHKRRKLSAIFSALGDGISTLSNLYFASKGAPDMTPKGTLSAKQQERWENLRKEREKKRKEYYNAYIEAKAKDDVVARDKRNYDYKVEQDKRNAEIAAQVRKQSQENIDRAFNEQVRQFAENQQRLREAANANAEAKKAATTQKTADKVRGKSMTFTDGKHNSVNIYESVWKASMPQVYAVLYEDMKAAHEANPNAPRPLRNMNRAEKEQFVKENWTRSQRARDMMLAYSQIDPAKWYGEVEKEKEADVADNNGLGWGKNNNDNSDEVDW